MLYSQDKLGYFFIFESMKKKSNKIALYFLFLFLPLAIGSYFLLTSLGFSLATLSLIYFIKDLFFVGIAAAFLYYVLGKNETNSLAFIDTLKHTDDEIKASNERYDIVAKATSDTIWDWKIQEDSISWNKGIESVFGYKENQVGNSSKWWFENIHPEDSIKMSIKLYSFLEQKTEKWQDQYRFRCADGTYKYVLDRGFLLKDKDGKAFRMIGAIQDITKQKEEEQRLKLLETVITQTKDSVIITEPDLNDENIPKIVYVNPAFSVMSGYQSEEIIGKSPSIFIGPNSDDQEYKKLINAIHNKTECQVETISYKKNKDEYWVSFSMLPVYNSDGELSHWVSIQRDITEEKRQEIEKEQLIRELTQNNKDLQQFSYITSHNLRAPLSNLTGLLNLVKDIPIENPELKEILTVLINLHIY